jgi:hypothetical protein
MDKPDRCMIDGCCRDGTYAGQFVDGHATWIVCNRHKRMGPPEEPVPAFGAAETLQYVCVGPPAPIGCQDGPCRVQLPGDLLSEPKGCVLGGGGASWKLEPQAHPCRACGFLDCALDGDGLCENCRE